jgi:hypothetical protein
VCELLQNDFCYKFQELLVNVWVGRVSQRFFFSLLIRDPLCPIPFSSDKSHNTSLLFTCTEPCFGYNLSEKPDSNFNYTRS